MPQDDLQELYARPGFMLRRAHQMATSLFLEATAEMRVTTTQFGILFLLSRRPDADQITVARLLGLDRSTTSMVLRSLEDGGLVARSTDPADKRRRTLRLTTAGQQLLAELHAPSGRAVRNLLAPLSPAERPVFLRLLGKLTHALNATTRVPIHDPGAHGAADNTAADGPDGEAKPP